MDKVAICIATFRRPEGLRRLLQSLDGLTFTRIERPEITLVIIDNDAENPVAADHSNFRSWTHLQLVYQIEPQRGLAHARNAALAAVPETCGFIAFIDDDEWVEPQWLEALLLMQRQTGSAAIQGPVRPSFEVPAPAWLVEGRYFEVGPYADGQSLTCGASGNCLLAKPAINELGLTFDLRFNLSGGEDVDFFDRLLASGQQLVAAADAVAHEAIPPWRMTLGFVLRRVFRTGNTLGLVSLARHGLRGRLKRIAKSLGRIGLGFWQALVQGLFSRTKVVKGLVNIVWGIGTLGAFVGVRVVHYGHRQNVDVAASATVAAASAERHDAVRGA